MGGFYALLCAFNEKQVFPIKIVRSFMNLPQNFFKRFTKYGFMEKVMARALLTIWFRSAAIRIGGRTACGSAETTYRT